MFKFYPIFALLIGKPFQMYERNNIKQNRNILLLTPEYVGLTYQVAPVSKRCIAVVVDWSFLWVLCVCVMYVCVHIVAPGFGYRVSSFVMKSFVFLLPFLSSFEEYYFRGRTVGKMVTKIKVLTDDCTPPTFLQCFQRCLIFPVDVLVIGFVLMSKTGQRFGDMASGCRVVMNVSAANTNISLDKDFDYVENSYKPMFSVAENLQPQYVNLIRLGLYEEEYRLHATEIAELIKKRLDMRNICLKSTDFLRQMLNDYLYYKSENTK